ncbi:MAG: hypothetical protein AAF399_17960 [Bacteroidota bacterium]
MKQALKHLYRTGQLLSVDVALGALAGGSLAAWWTRQEMPILWWMALPVSVWVIYTLDHLLDAYRLKDQAHTDRHLFHHQHFRAIAAAWTLAFLTCVLVFPWWLPLPMIWFALGMGGLVLIHLGLVKLIGDRISHFFHKEIGVAVIYTAGVWGGPLSLMTSGISVEIWLLLLQYFLLALINLLIFSTYEHDIDEIDGHTSFVRAIGTGGAQKLIGGIVVMVVGIGIAFLWNSPRLTDAVLMQVILMSMLALLTWVAFAPGLFQTHERYRLWGDLVFLIPGVIWLI